MESCLPSLLLMSPLPPARNGIADYAAALVGALAPHYRCTIACADWLAEAPPGIPVVDPVLAHRLPESGGRILHQIGNNPDHGFVLRALRHLPGVTTLHDPGLLHLHESTGEAPATILAGMRHAAPRLAATYAAQLHDSGFSTRANHLLFDIAGEVLARSRAVVVHSRFALQRLRLTHGEVATAHVVVIPHPIPAEAPPDRAAARARLGIPESDFLVVTAGFAARAKRLDWLLAALEGLPDIRWIHAGGIDPGQAAAIAARATVTGHLKAARFADHIAAADVLVNLRFPSGGESSGPLARGLAAGVCCIVSDTGAYAELPRDAVIHLPLADTIGRLAATLAGLRDDPGQAAMVGAAGQRHARTEMTLAAVAHRYRDVIEASCERPVAAFASPVPGPLLQTTADPARVAEALAGRSGACRLRVEVADLALLARLSLTPAGLLPGLLPPRATIRGLRVEPDGLLLDLDLAGAG
ncbi:MAG: glycosyltransferase [Acetobacteraceae bacterium]|nr:MAG: glycosyltransferase [Acetobacteraceae bacterium]